MSAGSGISNERLWELINEVLHERFVDVDIQTLEIDRDFDEDGDEILRVKVVFETVERLDSERASGVARHIMSRLASEGDNAFPVISYIAKSELGKSNSAASA